jgi:uncharacterized membrane protein
MAAAESQTDSSPARTNVHPIERAISVAGGGALAAWGLSRRSKGGVALALLGGGLVARGALGKDPVYGALGVSTASSDGAAVTVERAVTIDAPADRLYRYWRDFANLPRFMDHLESVTVLDDRRTRWTAKAPGGKSVTWDAEIEEERPNEAISWRSLPGAQIGNSGTVRFTPAPGDRGTEVHVTLTYEPPAGKAGALAARLLGEEPDTQVREDLRRFKQIMEAGEIPTTDGQPSGREETDE